MSTMLQQQPHQQQGQQGQQQLAPHPGLSQDPSKSHQAPQSVQVSSPYTTVHLLPLRSPQRRS
ncbi:hypothetical protein H107_02936 [Trichophyton rubrum CBS 202.88]|nr:hypothetical protein H107_02936 [Trichophyton rubrum CBS 202.88]